MDYDDIALNIIVPFLIAVGVFFIVDGIFAVPSDLKHAKAIERHYVPSQISHGVISTGKTTTITTNYSPEEYLVAVESANGEIFNVECSPELYYSIEGGQEMGYVEMLGFVSGITYSKKGVKK